MSEANEDGPAVIVVVEGEEAAGAGEVGGEVSTEVDGVEVDASDAVVIAAIEAERDVELARINAETREHEADTQVAQSEVIAEAMTETEIAECRARIQSLELELAELRAAQSTPPLSEELPPSPPLPSESMAEDGPRASPVEPEAQASEPVEEPPKPKRKAHRWI